MAKRDSKKYPMPQWLWNLYPRDINTQQKRFLAFIWSCGDTGCRSWNYYLAKMYHVNPRTIRRWITRLDRLQLIWINFPRTRHRTIYRMRFHHALDYFKFRARLTTYVDGTKMSYINTPKDTNKLKKRLFVSPSETAESPAKAGDGNSPSGAGGLSGSGGAPETQEEL